MANRKTIVIGSEKYSGQGYFYMAIKDSHLFDEIEVKSNKYNWDVAEVVIYYLQLNGWQESDVSGYEEKEVRSRCQSCHKTFKGQKAHCQCGGVCREFSYLNKVVVLQKIGVLQAHQEVLLSKKKSKETELYIQAHRNRQAMKDSIILTRWE